MSSVRKLAKIVKVTRSTVNRTPKMGRKLKSARRIPVTRLREKREEAGMKFAHRYVSKALSRATSTQMEIFGVTKNSSSLGALTRIRTMAARALLPARRGQIASKA